MIRVVLPAHLKALASVTGEVIIEEATIDEYGVMSTRDVLDALEARYPALSGTMRDPVTGRRRAFVRFFACREDLSHDPPDDRLPEAVLRGHEPLLVVGAMAGG